MAIQKDQSLGQILDRIHKHFQKKNNVKGLKILTDNLNHIVAGQPLTENQIAWLALNTKLTTKHYLGEQLVTNEALMDYDYLPLADAAAKETIKRWADDSAKTKKAVNTLSIERKKALHDGQLDAVIEALEYSVHILRDLDK